jgi:hypothetical protein
MEALNGNSATGRGESIGVVPGIRPLMVIMNQGGAKVEPRERVEA